MTTPAGGRAETGDGSRSPVRRRSTAWAWLLLAVLLAATTVVWLERRSTLEGNAAEVGFDEATAEIAGPGLDAALAPYGELLEELAALGPPADISRDEFLDFLVDQSLPSRLSATYAVVVTERVPVEDLDEFEARIEAFETPAGERSPTLLTLDPEPQVGYLDVVLHSAPNVRYNAIGLDVSSFLTDDASPFLPEATIERAVERGEPTMSPAIPYSLVEQIGQGYDPTDPTARDPWLAILGYPILDSDAIASGADPEAAIAGFAAIVFDVENLLGRVTGAGQGGIGVEVVGDTLAIPEEQIQAFSSLYGEVAARALEGGEKLLASSQVEASVAAAPGGASERVTLDVFGEDWTLRFTELETFPQPPSTSEQWIWLGAGIVISVLVFALVFAQLRARQRALAAVDAATGELQETAAELRRSKEAFRDAFETEKQLAERLREADRLKSEFLSMASHELRTPLTAAAAFIDTVLVQWDRLDEEQSRELLARASVSTRDLTRLVEQLLASIRLDDERLALEPAPLPLAALVEAVTRQIAPLLSDHRVEVDVPDALAVMADPGAFGHVLANLLTNAAKYSEPGTRIDVVAVPAGDEVEIHVTDEGVGIAPEHLDRVFDRFFQVEGEGGSRRGMGVGLAIVRHYVGLLGGRVRVDSSPGVGSTFSFTLPRADVDAPPPRAPGTGPEGRTREARSAAGSAEP